MSAAVPVIPTRDSSARDGGGSQGSPSQELALTLAGIRLDDVADEGEEEAHNGDISSILRDVSAKLDLIKEQFFTIQERRHAGVFALTEQAGSSSSQGSPPTQREQEGAEKSIALDLAMAHLNALFEAVSEGMRVAERHVSSQQGSVQGVDLSPRRRTASRASLDSFDDVFAEMSVGEDEPAALRKRYEDLAVEWARVQVEAKNLEEELSGDKYLLVFTSIGEQMEGMMESLDKALASCHDFVFAFHKDRAERVLSATGSPQAHTSSYWTSAEDRLNQLRVVKRSFDVKKSAYGPACEQMFVSLEKGVKQRSTQNGTILRRFSELKTRWRGLRERVSAMDKDLKRIEGDLMHRPTPNLTPSKSSPLDQSPSPNRSSLRPKSRLRDRNDSATNTPTSMSRSISIGDLYGESIALSPSDLNVGRTVYADGPFLSPRSPPTKPPKSAYRRSMLEGHSLGGTDHQTHLRSVSSTAVPLPSVRSSSRPIAPSSSSSRQQGLSTASPSRYTRAGSEPPSQTNSSFRWNLSERPPSVTNEEMEESLLESDDISFSSVATMYQRPASASGTYQRPPSAAGSYYRPPTSTGHRSDAEGPSRIPRLATANTARHGNDISSGASATSERPGSAMSYSSSTAYGRSPSAKYSSTRSQHPPSSFYNHDRGNRLSMQTPEPTIAARVQRMNIFAPKATPTGASSKRSSRPPPAKYNVTGYGAASGSNSNGASHPPSPASTANVSPSIHRTQPLNITKRSSAVWSAQGRTTPLSAAALAKVPSARDEIGHRNVSGTTSTSVANFRSQRAGATKYEYGGVGSYTPSVMSGRETPTYSEGGGSSVWGGGASRRLAAVYSYRPNANDALDVEVAAVVNSLGMAIERVDPPLPRGVKEMNPSSTKTVRYELGGKVIVCKLLQLVSGGGKAAGMR